MARALITEDYLNDIADAIRFKNGTSKNYTPGEMAAAISALPDEVHEPITINIAATENQIIYVFNEGLVNGPEELAEGDSYIYTLPDTVTFTAWVEPDQNYTAGTVNQASVVAHWGDTLNFSATPAIEGPGYEATFVETSSGPYNTGDTFTGTITFTALTNIPSKTCSCFAYAVLDSGDTQDMASITIPALSTGQTYTYNLSYTVSEENILYEELSVIFEDDDMGWIVYEDSFETVEPEGDLSIEIYGNSTANNAQFTVTNTGNLTLTDLTITNDLTSATWYLNELVPGATSTVYNLGDISSAYGLDLDYVTIYVGGNSAYNSVSTSEQLYYDGFKVSRTVTMTLNVPSGDESSFENTIPVRLNGTTYYLDPYDSIEAIVPDGYSYSLTLPQITGYTRNPSSWQGTVGQDISLAVTYTRAIGSMTYNFQTSNGYPVSVNYTLTVAGNTTSGTANGTLNISGYVGDSYTLNFTTIQTNPEETYMPESGTRSGTLSSYGTVTIPFIVITLIDYETPL